jgi:elongator complex protein 3
MEDFYAELIATIKRDNPKNEKELSRIKREIAVKHKVKDIPTNIEILLHSNETDFKLLKKTLLSKPGRSISGVAPVAIMTKPMPCPHGKCIMCPGGVKSAFGNVPQSYTGKEPATLRAIRNNYDAYLQVFNRLEQYIITGHNCEKVELIIMGGTFPSFPKQYQEKFITEAFQAMNDFSGLFYDNTGNFNLDKFRKYLELPGDTGDLQRTKIVQSKLISFRKKKAKSLLDVQRQNQTAKIRCVALCIETRPDYGLLKEGKEMLRLGCTRVELGIQSVYNEVLKKIKRGHSVEDTKKSIRILKDLGFKIAGHYMPGLPGTNRDKDLAGMKKLFSDPDLKPDMLKLYPCMLIKGTKLYTEYKRGKFKPLSVEEAAELISEFKSSVPEYCRIIRIQRDIPETQISAGAKMTNLRQYIEQKHKPKCRCIRCREPRGRKINWNKVKIKRYEYYASEGKEFFISAEDIENDILIGFLRMRFPSQSLLPEIVKNSALIRELHVYGTAAGIDESGEVQHHGWGKKLMKTAEEIAEANHKEKILVISGVGVREYYKKLGYKLEGTYMVKKMLNLKNF